MHDDDSIRTLIANILWCIAGAWLLLWLWTGVSMSRQPYSTAPAPQYTAPAPAYSAPAYQPPPAYFAPGPGFLPEPGVSPPAPYMDDIRRQCRAVAQC